MIIDQYAQQQNYYQAYQQPGMMMNVPHFFDTGMPFQMDAGTGGSGAATQMGPMDNLYPGQNTFNGQYMDKDNLGPK